MVNVAIAGAGAVGRALVDVIAAQSRHDAIVLSRKPADLANLPVPVVQVNYNAVDSLVAILEAHNIHTVISTFGINGSSLSISQLNLIKAAEKSKATKRFIPSSFSIPYPKEYVIPISLKDFKKIDPFSAVSILPPLKDYFQSLEVLETTSLEWAVVLNGTFLEYFAPVSLKSYHPHLVLVLDMDHNAAAIPGDGNTPVTFTYTFDVARFVVAALDLEKWPRELRIVGDELTYNELVLLAEQAKGCKFDVAYDSVEQLEASKITELPGHKASYGAFPKERLLPFLAIFELWMATGQARIERSGSLNDLFPDIKPLSAKEMMEKYWKK